MLVLLHIFIYLFGCKLGFVFYPISLPIIFFFVFQFYPLSLICLLCLITIAGPTSTFILISHFHFFFILNVQYTLCASIDLTFTYTFYYPYIVPSKHLQMKLSLSTENTAASLRPARNGSLANTPVHRHGITADTMSLQSFHHDFDQSTTTEKSHCLASDDSLVFETPDSSFDSPPELPSPPIPPRQVPPQRPPPPQLYTSAINQSTSLRSSAPFHTSSEPHHHHSLSPFSSSSLIPSSSGTNLTNNTSNYQSSPISRYSPATPPLKPLRTIGRGSSGSGFESDFVDAQTSSFAPNHHSPRLMESSFSSAAEPEMRSLSGTAAERLFGRGEEVCVPWFFFSIIVDQDRFRVCMFFNITACFRYNVSITLIQMNVHV